MGIRKRMEKSDFHRFYEAHADRVYRFVLFRVGMNKETAEDLTSEIFMKALAHFANYDPKKSSTAWIMTIARNHVINHYRDKKETVDIEEVAAEIMGSDARADVMIEDEQRCLSAAMQELEPKDRQLIEWKYLQGYRYNDIAALVGKTAGAVRIEAHRAIKKLKALFKQRYEPGHTTTEEVAP